ncbi:hypothetical protein Daus18300_011572 [Diaporthe australafricana]|uniref:Uncharacterized protein n=1 Tax=Diaporthe australafricana TaxID=127596 RepID=A0ABR3W5S5_9PEZI
MGRSTGHRAEASKPKGATTPWHKAYKHDLDGLIKFTIPKHIRSIDGAKARLRPARSVKAANVEHRHIAARLAKIDEAYSRIRCALRDGNDIFRWNEYPGLQAIVEKVDHIRNRDVPGGPLKYDVPKFEEVPFDKTIIKTETPDNVPKFDNVPVHKAKTKTDIPHSVLKTSVLASISTQNRSQVQPGVSVGTQTPTWLPLPQFATASYQHQPPYQYGYPYQPSQGPPLHRAPHSYGPPSAQPLSSWQGVFQQHYELRYPPSYPVMSYYQIEAVRPRPDGGANRQVGPQTSGIAGPQQPQAFPQPLPIAIRRPVPTRLPVQNPPGVLPAFLQPPPPPRGPPAPGSFAPPGLPTATRPGSASGLGSDSAKQVNNRQHSKRKLSDSLDSSIFGQVQPLKRRLEIQSGRILKIHGPQHSQ